MSISTVSNNFTTKEQHENFTKMFLGPRGETDHAILTRIGRAQAIQDQRINSRWPGHRGEHPRPKFRQCITKVSITTSATTATSLALFRKWAN